MQELFRQDAYLRYCEATVVAASADGIELDRTVFYPLGGGQPGDIGHIRGAGGNIIEILDTRKVASGGRILHVPAETGERLPATGEAVQAEIDWQRRYRHMRFHTCLHLLCALVDAPVTGGSIAKDKARLDFDLPEQTLDKVSLTEQLNELITADHPVTARWISDAELQAQPELIRTMSVTPPSGRGQVRLVEIPGVDLQPCGGTHVAHTAEIGRVAVRKIEKKGRQNRRVILTFDE